MTNLTKWVREPGLGIDGSNAIILDTGDWRYNHIVSITKRDDSLITFTEECDNNYDLTMSKEDAKLTLLEALAWLDEE